MKPAHTQRFDDAKADAGLAALMALSPAQLAAFVTANVNTPAEIHAAITSLALAVRFLYMREM